MVKKNMAKSRGQRRRIVFYLIAVIIAAMVIEILILNSFNKRNANKTSLVLLNQVVSIIEENEKNENELIETLKEDYIIRAQTVSYILDAKPEAEQDVEELKKIAGMMKFICLIRPEKYTVVQNQSIMALILTQESRCHILNPC